MLKMIPRVKLRDVVADRLKEFIVEGNLKAGDKLPTETELAEQFGVSRLSIREATKSLEFLGIVEARPRRGLTVGSIDMERVTKHLGFHPALHDVSPQHLIGTRIVIETGVMPYVSEQMQADSGIYQRLNAINEDLRKATKLKKMTELDITFHRELIGSSGLPPLESFTDLLAVFFKRFRDNAKRAEWSLGIEDHQAIIDALKTGDTAAASVRIRSHIERHIRYAEMK